MYVWHLRQTLYNLCQNCKQDVEKNCDKLCGLTHRAQLGKYQNMSYKILGGGGLKMDYI